VCVPRQNGKGGIIEARQLAGLYLIGERLQIYSAHLFDTSLEAFRRLTDLVEGRDELTRRVKRISRAHGEEGIELYGPKGRRVTGTQRIRFRTRTKGGGRGFSGDNVFFDEAMIFPEVSHAAILPILSARPNPQAWYLGSAVDQTSTRTAASSRRPRARPIRGDDASPTSSTPPTSASRRPRGRRSRRRRQLGAGEPGARHPDRLRDRRRRARIARRAVVRGRAPRRRRLAEPRRRRRPGHRHQAVGRALDPDSEIVGPICFAFDVTPDRGTTTIAVAGFRADGLPHVEIVDRRRGTHWVPERILELRDSHDPARSSATQRARPRRCSSPLENLGVLVDAVNVEGLRRRVRQLLRPRVPDDPKSRLRHLGTGELRSALKGAKTAHARRGVGVVAEVVRRRHLAARRCDARGVGDRRARSRRAVDGDLVKKLWLRLVCWLRGHRDESRTHYMRNRVLSITRCGRCGRVERAQTTKTKQYPLPRELTSRGARD
jgi:hypothetical protein